MMAVVLSQYQGIYMLRHIIYDIDITDTIESVMKKYYDIYNQTDTDKFILCHTMQEAKDICLSYGITV